MKVYECPEIQIHKFTVENIMAISSTSMPGADHEGATVFFFDGWNEEE